MRAYHSHHVCRASTQWQGVERKAYYGLSLYREKRHINEKRLLNNSHEKLFLMQYANRHFHFIPLSCHNKESFLNQNFLSLPSLDFDI